MTPQELIISSEHDQIAAVEAFVDNIKNQLNIDDEVYGNILICITEAANNAIIHGNKLDAGKKVTITAGLNESGKKVYFKVKDQGIGFDHNTLPDPTDPENLDKVNGRGVFLMKQLSDLVVFSDHGREVEMQFRI